nr:MAG TPA_asm: hypothetical protein [Caudoviricetes sp.]
MDSQTTTFTQNHWIITITGNKNMHFVNIEQRDDIAANITWEDGQAKVTPGLIASMTEAEATDYSVQINIAAHAAFEITKRAKEIIRKLPA